MRADRLSDPAVLDHYRELAREYPSMEPMLTLVKRLSRKAYADAVPAGTSLNALTVAWEGSELAAVEYLPRKRAFRVEYWTRDSRVIRHFCNANGAENLFDSFVLRLSLTSRGTD